MTSLTTGPFVLKHKEKFWYLFRITIKLTGNDHCIYWTVMRNLANLIAIKVLLWIISNMYSIQIFFEEFTVKKNTLMQKIDWQQELISQEIEMSMNLFIIFSLIHNPDMATEVAIRNCVWAILLFPINELLGWKNECLEEQLNECELNTVNIVRNTKCKSVWAT